MMFKKIDKFELPLSDRVVIRQRKHKKGFKKIYRDRYPKKFAKSEAIFHKWFTKNRDKFNCKLIKKGCGYYSFEGVIEAIELSINLGIASEIEFIFNYKDEFIDETECYFDISSIAYIGQEAYHPQKGFFDLDREDNMYTYYPTREALYRGDLFELMILKCNEKLSSKNSLYLFDYNGTTAAYIEASKEDDKNNPRVIRELLIRKTVEKKSYKELKKLFEEEKIYRVIKLDLFDSAKEPIVRYYSTKSSLC